MLHKELGAYLIAVGTLMVQKNKSLANIADDVYSDIEVADIMMKNGIDGLIAKRIARSQGSAAVRPLSMRTYESVAEQDAAEEEADGWDDEEDDDGNVSELEPAKTRAELQNRVDGVLTECLAQATLERMKHFDLSLNEITNGNNDMVWEICSELDEELCLDEVGDEDDDHSLDAGSIQELPYTMLIDFIAAKAEVK